jgi:hypothetical protein
MATTDGPSDTVLDETPARALKFMSAVSTNPTVRAILERRGYTDAYHEKGWELLLKASGYKRAAPPAAPSRPEAAAAIAELDKWDEPHFRIARAALAEFPEQRDFLFTDLEPQTGAGAVVSVTTFLDRLDQLEKDKNRKATRKTDLAALAKLSERGISEAERARLRGLLKVSMASPEPSAAAAKASKQPKPDAANDAEPRKAKLALWTFYSEWSEIARADIKRRDHLIQLGLAKRKAPKKTEKDNQGADA